LRFVNLGLSLVQSTDLMYCAIATALLCRKNTFAIATTYDDCSDNKQLIANRQASCSPSV